MIIFDLNRNDSEPYSVTLAPLACPAGPKERLALQRAMKFSKPPLGHLPSRNVDMLVSQISLLTYLLQAECLFSVATRAGNPGMA
ncbi:hypothetical protein D3C87_1682230 [compost metagenome]